MPSIGSWRFIHTSTGIENFETFPVMATRLVISFTLKFTKHACYTRSETSTPHEEQRQPLFTDFPRTTLGAPDLEPAG
jgi:hypothetical protein